MTDIFRYNNYRQFLKDFYEEQKALDKKYSHRFFADKIGLNSTGFFSDVLKGKRNLTPALILKFANALKLKNDEQDYFENLVHFNQAGTHEEKNSYYNKLLAFKKVSVDIIGKDQYEFYKEWYYSAIRELLFFYDFKDDYAALAKKLNPTIRPELAKKAILILEKLGLIKQNENGYYRQTSALISTGEEFKSMNVCNFQTSTIELAKEALSRHPREHRDISTLTLTFSEDSFEQAKLELDALRKRLLGLAEKDNKVDRVYQVNLQAYPLSKF
ncbi:MAG: TIGR02147 family protein [Fibrobacteres bacterium]|nr:TIGR02147 family protein [Fibrobacterota bacterium]